MDNFDLRKYLAENKLTNQSKLISEEFLFVNTDGDQVFKDEEGLYYFDGYKGEKVYYHPDYPPTRMSRKDFQKKFIVYDDEEENSSDLDFDDFLKKFPEVKDNNLAGEVYSIMQEQGSFDDYDDEEIVSFMKAAATWTDAEDVADYFDEPASDLGRLIASYYQEESGYEDYDDQWDNYLDYLFDQTEREGDDIDDWRIPD
jgi:hypothetical protein|tara:strand:- start:251 stop:850 length:600 start_codon:yes stop_codon:yes gene_type:complete